MTTYAARRPGEIAVIQQLRAVAAVSVVVFHAAERTGSHFGVGAAGVDVFFVISGFIMAVIGARHGQSPFEFLARRAERIVPLYWLVTLGVVALAAVAPPLFPNMQVTFEHLWKSLLFVPHTAPDGTTFPIIAPGWTLNYEAFFYLTFAATLLAPQRLRLPILAAGLGALAVIGIVTVPHSTPFHTYTSLLLLEFLAGVALGEAWRRGWALSASAGLGLILLGLVGFALSTLFDTQWESVRLCVWGAPAVCVVAGALSLEAADRTPRWPLLNYLGDASYSIYLVHALAISAIVRLAEMMHPALANPPLVMCAAVVAGVACYELVEKPLGRLIRRLRRPAAARPAV